jgi:hypothetical protein
MQLALLQEPIPSPRNQDQDYKAINFNIDNAVTLWIELKRAYLQMRGVTQGKKTRALPLTTNRDVLQLATKWSRELSKSKGNKDRDKSERARWKAGMDEVSRLTKGADPEAVYVGNESFWQDHTRRLAIYLESRKVRPSKWQLVKESISESLNELPDRLARGGATVGEGAKKAASFFADPIKLILLGIGGAIVLPPVISAVRGKK